ncbi:odorant receptor 13a-like [Polistes fuscatus]|uniref:odorant receptor 13a-like n=1 Tax=Polistes fuscatus TaxID=30207 RepID=UPI001CA7FC81|nr:odorant receptor 13a-like [Polistes fuscatus]
MKNPSETFSKRITSLKHRDKDIEYAIKYGRFILRSIGIWPDRENKIYKYLSNVGIVTGNLVLSFAIIPCGLHIIYEEKDTNSKLKLFGLLIFCMCVMIKYFALSMRRSDIVRCFECLRTDWYQVNHQIHRELMLKYAKIGRNLTMMCAVFMYSGGVIYHTILPFVSTRMIDLSNHTFKPLVYPSYSVLYDVQKSPTYEFVYFAHFMCGYIIYSITTGACSLAAMFAMHICGQIEILTTLIDDFVDGKKYNFSKNSTGQRLSIIVERHLRILRFVASLEELLQEVFLIEFAGSTFIICLLEYYCIMDWQENNKVSLCTYFILLISTSFNIFMLCYIGESLTNKTSKVGERCCTIEWYRLSPKITSGLILIIAISNNPVRITAGKMADLSLLTFSNILKTSIAYLNLLRKLII